MYARHVLIISLVRVRDAAWSYKNQPDYEDQSQLTDVPPTFYEETCYGSPFRPPVSSNKGVSGPPVVPVHKLVVGVL